MDAFVMRGLSHVANHVIIISTSTRILCVVFFVVGVCVCLFFTVQIWWFVKIFLLFIFFFVIIIVVGVLRNFFVCAMDEWMNRSTEIFSTAGYILCETFASIEDNNNKKYRYRWHQRERERRKKHTQCRAYNLDQSI